MLCVLYLLSYIQGLTEFVLQSAGQWPTKCRSDQLQLNVFFENLIAALYNSSSSLFLYKILLYARAFITDYFQRIAFEIVLASEAETF